MRSLAVESGPSPTVFREADNVRGPVLLRIPSAGQGSTLFSWRLRIATAEQARVGRLNYFGFEELRSRPLTRYLPSSSFNCERPKVMLVRKFTVTAAAK
jgi:hypothetical protein